MKQSVCNLLLLLITLPAMAQTEITNGNDCYAKKNYQCAIDNYTAALDKKSYQADQKYLLEFRIGDSYYILKQYDKSKTFLQQSIASNGSFMNSYWALADTYTFLNDNTSAIYNYRQALPLTNDNTIKESIWRSLGIIYYNSKDYMNSISEMKKITSRTGKHTNTDPYIGDAYFNAKIYDSALVYYKKSMQYYQPADAVYKGIKCFMGKCFRLLGNAGEAERLQDEALKIDPAYGEALWEKGILAFDKKEFTAAADWYKKAIPAFAGKAADSYTLLSNIASCYGAAKNYREELNWYMKRKEFSENKYADAYTIAARQYGRTKETAAAEKTCTVAIAQYDLDPRRTTAMRDDYAKLNGLAGKIVLGKKDTVKALQYFETAIKLSNGNFEANAGAGDIFWARKQPDEYKKYYTNIWKFSYDTIIATPKDIANVYGRAAFVEANQPNATTASYKTYVDNALQFDSLQKEAVLLWPLILSDNKLALLPTWRKNCLSVLNQAIKKYAGDKEYVSNLYNDKAVILDTKDTAAIRRSLEAAIKSNTDNLKAWDNLLIFCGSYDNAGGVVLADKLIAQLKPKKDSGDIALAYVYRGDFLWRLSKKTEAKAAWQEALVWDANNATAKERMKLQ